MRILRLAAATSALTVLIGVGPLTAPASAFTVSAPVLRYSSFAAGDGLTQPAIVPLFATPAVNPGLPIATTIGAIDYEGGQAVSYVANWLRCSPRNQASANCISVLKQISFPGVDAVGKSFLYTPTADDVGSYLRFSLTVESKTAAGALRAPFTVTNTPGTELLVVPLTSAGGVAATGVLSPGRSTAVEAYVWNVPNGSTVVSRVIAAYSCTSPTAGQSPGVTFDSAGCTNISAGLSGDANSAGFSTISLLLPLRVGGTYLVFDETMTLRTNGMVTVYKRRSPTQAISGSPSAVGPVPAPTPSATASAAPVDGGAQGGAANGGGSSDASGNSSPSADGATGTALTAAEATTLAAAAGVDVVRSPVVGTVGTGTSRGFTLRLTTPAAQARGKRQRLVATIRPRQAGTVRFVLTRTGADGSVAVEKVKVVTVRRGRSATTWVLAGTKPAGAYVILATYRPRRAATPGLTVAKKIAVT